MPTDLPGDAPGEPRSDGTYDGTYKGFSDAAAQAPRRRVLPRISMRYLAVGGVAAIALGLVLGVWARPNLGQDPSAAAERNAPPVPIEVNRPPPPEPLVSNGKLEVLSPDQARAANAYSAGPGAYVIPPSAYVPPAPPALPSVTTAPAQPQRLAQAPGRAGFDCSGARSDAEAMVCGDPDLAAADREMARAYRRALQSGAPAGQVRQDQRDFLAIREDAAHRSRRALAQAYQQRIEELNSIADDNADGPGN